MIESTEMQSLLDFAAGLARDAGAITQEYFKRTLEVQRKADNSLVTNADREVESFLRARIAETFPDDAILGEEEGERAGLSGRCWILDPIDGTYSFVHGVPLYGVLIGLEIDGESVVGAVNLPALNELVYAARGLGCFWNGVRTSVSATRSLSEALLLATDFGSAHARNFDRAILNLQMRVAARRTWGDCYGHILVATGRAEIMLDPIMNVWDCAPLLPILEEAGGTFTDWDGQSTIRGGNAISTNGALFNDVMEIIRENSDAHNSGN